MHSTSPPTVDDLAAVLDTSTPPDGGCDVLTFTAGDGGITASRYRVDAAAGAIRPVLAGFAQVLSRPGLGLFDDVVGYGLAAPGGICCLADRYGRLLWLPGDMAAAAGGVDVDGVGAGLTAMVTAGPGLHTPPADAGPVGPTWPAVTVRLAGTDGNVFSIIGRVAAALRVEVDPDAAAAFTAAAYGCACYDDVLVLVMRTVTVH